MVTPKREAPPILTSKRYPLIAIDDTTTMIVLGVRLATTTDSITTRPRRMMIPRHTTAVTFDESYEDDDVADDAIVSVILNFDDDDNADEEELQQEEEEHDDDDGMDYGCIKLNARRRRSTATNTPELCAYTARQYYEPEHRRGQFGFISGESYEHEEDPDYESNAQEKE